MSHTSTTCPMTTGQVLDAYFLEHRAKLLEIAAFLDRLDRARPSSAVVDDFRAASFRHALNLLAGAGSNRTEQLLNVFSDTTDEPIDSAVGMKGAHGASPTFNG